MLGSRLKKLRMQRKMSQQKLADIVGVNRTTIGKYELKNVRPAYEVLEKICRALHTTPEYLSGFDQIYPTREEEPRELISFIKEENYTLNGMEVTQKEKRRLSKIIEALYVDESEEESTKRKNK
ncbi:helix-turn-helix domain-containing protein [Pectinatus cerevisiiphilus]|uniref:DNA-binding XRE family transcriptional regulator n=1 Tax=Pectinatus cerevisiiphilus TaxID=86956 RepID=A0A4R3K3K3_9FIRM|nr:helix-turn-helix transcriptional regulator [Pectinatus cerevisiiphilus]TCS77270.1 DNA-binding XRE family transcriptional regulator [Pectinatus cerevisiiphilus]